jgi:glycosylphosphatidylinositol transamidase (GPIT) subunit GPI8
MNDLVEWYYQYQPTDYEYNTENIGQCDIKHIMMLPIKTITSVLKSRPRWCNEKAILSETNKQFYVYRGVGNVTSLRNHIRKHRYYVNIMLVAW